MDWRTTQVAAEFNAGGYVVLGVDLGGTKTYGAVSDLGGNVIEEVDIARRGNSGEDNFTRLTMVIDALLASPKIEGRRVRGIGVGAPGITLHRQGIVKWAYTLNWKDFPLKARLEERYSLPITVDNDVNLAALGELWFGAGQNVQNMILIAIGTGIGAGIIIDGSLYRGANEASGEIGNLLPGKEFLGKNFQDFGALERMASGTGIIERAKSIDLAQRSSGDQENLLVEEVFEAARQGQEWASEIVTEVVDNLAIAIANLAVSFDPELIVLGGGISHSADLLVQPILRSIDGTIPALPKLVVSSLGLRGAVMGAIVHVLHNTSNFYVVHKLS